MKFFLFVITFTLSFNLSLRAAGIDTTRIYPLLAKVQKAPRKSEVDSLLMYMASPTNIRYADTIVKVFRPLFDSAQARPLLLAGLAKYRCLNFELQIGKLISGIIQPDGQVNNLLLIAIKKSGGNLCYDLLIRHCQDGIRSANAGVFESKKKIWKELFRRNMIGTLSAMIQYYAYDNIGQSEMARFPIHQLMNTFIDEIAGSPALFAEALPALQYFLLSGDSAFQRDPEVAYFGFEGQDKPYRFPSLFLGERGTARHAINTKIFEKLVAGKSVYSIAVAADFLRGDDADLRRRAANVDFAPITNTQTIPELFNLSNDSVITKAVFRDRKKLTHNYSNLYLYAPHYIRTRKLLGFTDNEGFFNADTSYSEVNHKKVRDLYRVSLAQTIRSVSERFEIKSLVFVDTVKQFIRNARGLLPIRNYDDNFFDFSILFNGLINAVATAVRKEGFSKDIADSTASIIVGKEFDRKAILAFSLSQIRGKINLRQWDINFGSIDSIFKVICTRHSSEMRVNSEISPSLLQRPSSQLAVSKTIQQVKVLERKFCFSDAMYFEKVQYKDENNVIKVVDWYGTIPVSLLIPLMKELHILDFTKYSFAVTEWTSQQSSMNFRQLIDYIRIDPISSCNYLFFSLNKSAVKDKDLEELIILNPYRMPTNWEMERVILRDFPSAKPYYRDTLLNKRPWFTKLDFGGKRSAESGFPSGIGNFLGNYVAKDTAEYSRHKSGYAQPLLQYLLTKIYRRYNEHILSYNINEVSETNPCHDVDIFCHAGIITNENKNRKWSIETGRSIVSDLQVAEQFMDAWNLAGYNLRPESKAFLRQCLISPDFKQYYSTYELGEGAGTKYVNIEGQLKDLPEELKVILTLYPNFLSDYNLDMAGALNNSMENFSTAISRHYNYRYGSFSTQRLFNTAGYGAIRFWAPRFVPKGIFFRSAEGKIIASELSFINLIFLWFRKKN